MFIYIIVLTAFVIGYLYLDSNYRVATPLLLVIVVFIFKKVLLGITGKGTIGLFTYQGGLPCRGFLW